MKKLFLFSLITLFSFALAAQKPKDSKVIVTISDTSNIVKRLTDSLKARGYEVAVSSDKHIVTSDKMYDAKGMEYDFIMRIKVFFALDKVIFTGDYNLNVTSYGRKSPYEVIKREGGEGTITRNAWNELESVARIFGERIEYAQ
jgi:hypothetical protein